MRHGLGSASVAVDYHDEFVEFRIENPLSDTADVGAEGHGLTGMRERVELLGGNFAAGPEDGVFRVRAALPYDRVFESRLAQWREKASATGPSGSSSSMTTG